QIALIASRCWPLTPGDPPRTSIDNDASFGRWNTVHPVGPSSYSATPISSPGKSNSIARASAKSVRGTRRARSLVTGPLIGERVLFRRDAPSGAASDPADEGD